MIDRGSNQAAMQLQPSTLQALQATKRRAQSMLAQLRCGSVACVPPHSWQPTAAGRPSVAASLPSSPVGTQ